MTMTRMLRTLLVGMVGLGLVACSSAAARVPEYLDVDRWPPGNRALDRTLVVGTLIGARIHRSLRRDTPGEPLKATVSADVRNAHRWVVIPAGSAVELRITQWRPMLLDVTSVTVRGQVYPVSATIELSPMAVYPATGEAAAVTPGTPILFVLSEGFTAARRGGGTQ
jgi:hypothetical protein